MLSIKQCRERTVSSKVYFKCFFITSQLVPPYCGLSPSGARASLQNKPGPTSPQKELASRSKPVFTLNSHYLTRPVSLDFPSLLYLVLFFLSSLLPGRLPPHESFSLSECLASKLLPLALLSAGNPSLGFRFSLKPGIFSACIRAPRMRQTPISSSTRACQQPC